MIYTRMKRFYLVALILACIACKEKTPETDTETKNLEVAVETQDNLLI